MLRKAVSRVGVALIVAALASFGPVPASAASKITNHIKVRPAEGPGGTEVWVRGYASFGSCPGIGIYFRDSSNLLTYLGGSGTTKIRFIANLPRSAALGSGKILALRGYRGIDHRCHGSLAAETPFAVTKASGIFGFTPRSGPVGTAVTITGIRFTGATTVKFGGTPADFTVDSDSQITATVPAGAGTGPIKIHTHPGKVVSGPNFVVT